MSSAVSRPVNRTGVSIRNSGRGAPTARHALRFGADDDVVGPHEVVDRGALALELGVRGDVEVGVGSRLADDARDLAYGADRHCRLGNDDGVGVERCGDLARDGADIAEIGVAVAAAVRRADRDEDRIGAIDGGRGVGAEREPAAGGVAPD